MTLRGSIPDPNQMTPVGLNGGRLAEALQDLIKETDGECYLGTLPMDDVLDLSNDNIRLFAVDRDKYGYAQIKRIKISRELIDEGQPLSRLWINGRIGGVPELI